MDWQLGKHGLRMHFNYKGRRYGGTYLPDVAVEQGWDKEETLVSLMRKAGWDGKEKDWKKVELSCQRYEGMRADADYEDYKLFRDWLKTEGLP
jgi:AMMECR1 domain-containing protein